jgi:hypothetical protein
MGRKMDDKMSRQCLQLLFEILVKVGDLAANGMGQSVESLLMPRKVSTICVEML